MDPEHSQGKETGGQAAAQPWLELGRLLLSYRRRSGYRQQDVAAAAAVSASLISYCEKGRRRPQVELLVRLGELYRLSEAERDELFAVAGYAPPPRSTVHPAVQALAAALNDASVPQPAREELAAEVLSLVAGWQRLRRRSVHKAVVPIAGWQSRLFSSDQVEKMLRPAVAEALESGIEDVAIIVPPGCPTGQWEQRLHQYHAATRRAMKLRLHFVVQQQPLGLGHAILQARRFIGEEPFAVILPDDIVLPYEPPPEDWQPCTRRLIEVYEHLRACVLAMQRLRDPESAYGGVVHISAPPVAPHLYLVQGLEEKPSANGAAAAGWAIVGRYILTPAIFQALETTPPHPRTQALELTRALETLQRRRSIYAYETRDFVYRITPTRAVVQALLDQYLAHPRQPALLQALQQIIEDSLTAIYELERRFAAGQTAPVQPAPVEPLH
jgi:UTP--glucose-1-phosphate uridylyltransferase